MLVKAKNSTEIDPVNAEVGDVAVMTRETKEHK